MDMDIALQILPVPKAGNLDPQTQALSTKFQRNGFSKRRRGNSPSGSNR